MPTNAVAPLTKEPTGDVAQIFNSYPPKAQRKLMQLRRLILSTAKKTPGVGELTETLKWSEPAYLTEHSKSGSTIRIAWKAKTPESVAMYLNCQTSLVDSYRTWFPELTYEGNRAVVFPLNKPLPTAELKVCIEAALTYHQSKRKRK